MPNLRLLELEGGNLVGDFKNLFWNLKWLSWHRCPSHLQAINLCLRNLVVLKLSNSEILENWNGWGPCLENSDLQVIHLLRCYLSTTPDFSRCLKLRILVFAEHCPESPQIDPSIGKLERLKRLEIIAAGIQQSKLSRSPHFDLCEVPSAICRLKNLSTLKLEGMSMRELDPSIGEMVGLACLSLVRCDRLRKLPDSIGKLRLLLELDLFDTRIRELPDSIGDLKMMEKMHLECTRIRSLPNSIGGLESLKRLLMPSSKIRVLPNSIGDLKSLEELNLTQTQIRELPNTIEGLESLRYLCLSFTKITALPASIGYLKRLNSLEMSHSKIRELPDSIGDLKSLERMNLAQTQVTVLPKSIGGLESLFYLGLADLEIIELPASIGCLKMLNYLDMSRSKIRELPKAIGMLENLERLAYGGSRNMDMKWPPKLSTLWISSSDDPQSLTLSPQLSYFSICCDDPQSLILPPQLSSFSLNCDHPQALPGLPLGLRSLELKRVKSPIIQSLSSKLRYLSELSLNGCGLREIVIEQLESLHSLNVLGCSLLVLGLSSLPRLEQLQIIWCPQLIEIRDLGEMESLKALLMTTCSSIERLPKLSKLDRLRWLHVKDCRSLRCLPDLPNSLLSSGNWRSTESSPESSPELSKRRRLSEHRRLWALELSHCESLQGAIPNGWHPDIHACPLLGEFGDVSIDCDLCRKSNPGLCASLGAMRRWYRIA